MPLLIEATGSRTGDAAPHCNTYAVEGVAFSSEWLKIQQARYLQQIFLFCAGNVVPRLKIVLKAEAVAAKDAHNHVFNPPVRVSAANSKDWPLRCRNPELGVRKPGCFTQARQGG